MKLVTFQTINAIKELFNKGYLIANKKYINLEKSFPTYEWIIEKMNKQIPRDEDIEYPIWAWVKFKNGICPPKHKGEPVENFEVKITFHKNSEDVFITDYRRFSFLLNNMYIPDNKKDREKFEQELIEKNITKEELKAYVRPDKYKNHREDRTYIEMCQKIRNSFDKCITTDSDVLQGCVWKMNLDEVEKIEMLSDSNYRYGSFNYIRSNGKRFNWREDFYKRLK